nr:MAG: hypothetical protein 2 [Leviviridae sp.]
MSLTLNGSVFSEFRHNGNRCEYISDTHSDVLKDTLVLTSASPKQTMDSYGNRRSSANLIKTVPVVAPDGETVRKDMKLEVLSSVPVGVAFTEFEAECDRMVALLSDTTNRQKLFEIGITQL